MMERPGLLIGDERNMIERQAAPVNSRARRGAYVEPAIGSKKFEPFFVTDPFSERIAMRARKNPAGPQDR
jgi:hypothetical protein